MMGNGEGGVYLRDQSADRSVSGGDFEGELGVSIDDPKEFGAGEPGGADDRCAQHSHDHTVWRILIQHAIGAEPEQTEAMPLMSTAGRLLVATPPLVDENFDRTVVYMVDHDHAGAVGVILNRPDSAHLPEPLDRWLPLLAEPAILFAGGPVAPEALLALGIAQDGADRENLIVGQVRSVDLSGDPALIASELRGLRIFTGYSGWGPGQLDAEIATGAWIVVDSEDGDLVDSSPDSLWRRVLARQGGRLAWLASAPDDLSAN